MHHHRAKATILRKLLETTDFLKSEDVIDKVWGFEQEDYERMLRIEMRANLFHAIDTLFTLYFCLQPNNDAKVDDFGLFRNLNKRIFYYEKIREIAEKGTSALDILNTEVNFNGQKIKLGQYLFYYAFKQDKFPPGLSDSIEAIKYALHLLAIEMSDTAEYNSYKHALRSLPAFTEFAFANPDTMEILVKFDAKNSMTYFQELKNGGFSYNTKVFDSERDFRMTLLASNLVCNIIMFRRGAITRDMKAIPVGYYSKESVDECAERGENTFQFTSTITTKKTGE
jgi:hypothetical protein